MRTWCDCGAKHQRTLTFFNQTVCERKRLAGSRPPLEAMNLAISLRS